MQDWISAELATVGEYRAFPGADGLEQGLADIGAAHPEAVTRRRVGTSRLGDAIHAVQIGSGPREALVFGLPHPNEPVGGLTALHLAERLAADQDLRHRLGMRFTIISCIDPDGLRRNEGWLAGPFTRTHYARHFYRPAGDEQIEWTFPVEYQSLYFDAVLPETAALVRLIDQLRPQLMVSLHNSELGGAYYYLSRPVPPLYPVLQEIPTSLSLPLDRGEPEGPEIVKFDDAIFEGLGIKPIYDHAVAAGRNPAEVSGGDGSGGYAERYGTLTLFSEVPYWSHPDSSDPTATDESYADLLREQGRQMDELTALLQRVLDRASASFAAAGSPYLTASRYFIPALARMGQSNRERADQPGNDRPATVAERFSLSDVVTSFQLRYGGMLLRALDGELAIGNAAKAIREGRGEIAEAFEKWCAAADVVEAQCTVHPIRSLVATQYGAILATAAHLAAERPEAERPGSEQLGAERR
jgi:hypothetical protein